MEILALQTEEKLPEAYLKSVFIWNKTVPLTGGKFNFICGFKKIG